MLVHEVVPQLRKFAEREEQPKRKKLVEEMAESVAEALNNADNIMAATREHANMSQSQRDALHELIKQFSKELNIDMRNKIMKDANRILKG
jgi:predicted solute-binding protein